MTLDWHVIWAYRSDLLQGFVLTLQLSLVAIAGASLLGTLVGCLRASGGFLARRLTALYVELLRNIPIVVKLFLAHFILGIDALPAGIAALILHQSAYVADVTAAGLRSVPSGQADAALALGLSRWRSFCLVVLPQAARAMIPPLTTQYTQIVKNSSVVMLVALQELTFMTQRIEHETFRGLEAATTATILYAALALAIAAAMASVERALERRAA